MPVPLTTLPSPMPVYQMSADAVVKAQATDAQLGLGTEEAHARIERPASWLDDLAMQQEFGERDLRTKLSSAISNAMSRTARSDAANTVILTASKSTAAANASPAIKSAIGFAFIYKAPDARR